MSFTNIGAPAYYPEDYEYSLYYQNELQKYQSPATVYSPPPPDSKNIKKRTDPAATINYYNERKCPIYVHHINTDSSVYNNYGQKLVTPRKSIEKPTVVNASKFVLDKLEETYWATWKPKKGVGSPSNLRTSRKGQSFTFPNSRPAVFQEHYKAPRNEFNRPHGDVNDNIIKHYKATHFHSGSTTDSIAHEANQKKYHNLMVSKKSEMSKSPRGTTSKETIATNLSESNKPHRPRNSRSLIMTKQDSISQEIQTDEVHYCPVILKESDKTGEENEDADCDEEQKHDELFSDKVEDWNRRNSEEVQQAAKRKGNKGKKHLKEGNSKPASSKKESKKQQGMPVITEGTDNSPDNATGMFIEHKDSIEITKRKQEKAGPKEHFQQPKCIRLYRKSGLAAGYIKGGTYPLKSCLKKDGSAKGNFKLGAPGSTLFVTTSSFSSRKRK